MRKPHTARELLAGHPYQPWTAEVSGGESRWPATLAVIAAIVIQYVLPDKLLLGPRYLLPGSQAADYLLSAVTVDCACLDFPAAEPVSITFYEHPIAVLQPQYCAGGHDRPHLRALRLEMNRRKHVGPQQSVFVG